MSQYVPDVYQALSEKFHDRHEHVQSRATSQPTTREAAAGTTAAVDDNGDSTAATAGEDPADDVQARDEVRHWSPAKKIGFLFLFAAILFAIAFAAPVLMGMSNIIGLLIIAFALWEARKINRKRAVEFTGPHSIAAPPSTVPASPLPPAGA